MTVLPDGDVRAFYDALGISLPGWALHEAPVHCFAAPESHAHEDRRPSTSVNLATGAWCCHGCGAAGGAYDAALAVGLTPRSSIELMIAHGLLDERRMANPKGPAKGGAHLRVASRVEPSTRAPLTVSEEDVRRWQASLSHRPELLTRLANERGWSYPTVRQLGIGLDAGSRLAIPIRSRDGSLRGVLRYQPWHAHQPKMLAVRGTRLGLIPHPANEPSRHVLLVEGPPDMVAARSRGFAAIAVPGTQAWRPEWADLLATRTVTVVMDCDPPGRDAAKRIAQDLQRRTDVRIVDLSPARDDGYDLTDALLDHWKDPVPSFIPVRHERSEPHQALNRGVER